MIHRATRPSAQNKCTFLHPAPHQQLLTSALPYPVLRRLLPLVLQRGPDRRDRQQPQGELRSCVAVLRGVARLGLQRTAWMVQLCCALPLAFLPPIAHLLSKASKPYLSLAPALLSPFQVCKYIDIPLQHISNLTLLAMNRPPQVRPLGQPGQGGMPAGWGWLKSPGVGLLTFRLAVLCCSPHACVLRGIAAPAVTHEPALLARRRTRSSCCTRYGSGYPASRCAPPSSPASRVSIVLCFVLCFAASALMRCAMLRSSRQGKQPAPLHAAPAPGCATRRCVALCACVALAGPASSTRRLPHALHPLPRRRDGGAASRAGRLLHQLQV